MHFSACRAVNGEPIRQSIRPDHYRSSSERRFATDIQDLRRPASGGSRQKGNTHQHRGPARLSQLKTNLDFCNSVNGKKQIRPSSSGNAASGFCALTANSIPFRSDPQFAGATSKLAEMTANAD
jgi:hypothetical protein